MNQKDNFTEVLYNETVSRWISALLVAAMIACAALTMGSFFQRLMPSWQPWVMAVVCFFIALDGQFIRRRMKEEAFPSPGWFSTAIAQAAVIFLLIVIIIGLSHGLKAFIMEFSQVSQGNFGSVFTFDLLFALGMAVLTWMLGGYFDELLEKMSLQQALIDQAFEDPGQRAEPLARDQMLSMIFTILIFLVMFVALVRLDMNAFTSGNLVSLFYRLPPLAGGGAGALAFFMLSIVLLSQTQFLSLHTSWSLARIPVSDKLAGRWALYSLLFLVILAGVVSLLPTRYSMGFLSSLGYLIDKFSQFIALVIQAFILIFAFLINLPFLLLGKPIPVTPTINPTPTPESTPALTPGAVAPVLPTWLETARSIFFWLVVLGVTLIVLRQYLMQHQEVLSGLKKIPGWRLLSRFWAWVRSTWRWAEAGARHTLEQGKVRLETLARTRQATATSRFVNLNRLSPRQKVYFYYLSLVRRGNEQGIPRQVSQTPSEYAQVLDSALPVAETDIDQLTSAFIEARYTRHAVQAEDASSVRKTWGRIRAALRNKKKPSA